MKSGCQVPFIPGLKTYGDGRIYEDDTDQVLHTKLFNYLKKMSTETKERIAEVAKEWESVQQIMDYAAHHVNKDWLDARDKIPGLLADIRSLRMSLSAELKQIQQAAKDMDEWTSGEESLKRKQQLSEIVSLCERFKAIQEQGVFDRVMEVLLKHAP